MSDTTEEVFLEGYKEEVKTYEKPSVTVDVCICRMNENKLEVLLIKRKNHPFQNCYAIPGGFLDIPAKENLSDTAKRELEEETHIKGVDVHELKTYSEPDRDPRLRVITVAYFALLSPEKIGNLTIKADDDAYDEEWFDLHNLPDMAFDHNVILKDLLKRLSIGLQHKSYAFDLVNAEFTWTELHEVYEAVLNVEIDKANFRKKIASRFDVEKITGQFRTTKSRKAQCLRFLKTKSTF